MVNYRIQADYSLLEMQLNYISLSPTFFFFEDMISPRIPQFE